MSLMLFVMSGCFRTLEQCRTQCSMHGLVPTGVQTNNDLFGGGQCTCGTRAPEPQYEAPVAPTKHAGCSKDVDCKGDRVCHKGICEDPA